MKVSINLNDKVKVRVLPKGYLAWQKYYRQFNVPFPAMSYAADAQGYHTFKLYEVMVFFGHFMGDEFTLPIDPTIEIIGEA